LKHHVGYNETVGHISDPLYKGHLSITANFDQSLGWLLYTGFTVYRYISRINGSNITCSGRYQYNDLDLLHINNLEDNLIYS